MLVPNGRYINAQEHYSKIFGIHFLLYLLQFDLSNIKHFLYSNLKVENNMRLKKTRDFIDDIIILNLGVAKPLTTKEQAT